MRYVIYTDGGCDKNPGGKGGLGVVIINESMEQEEFNEAYEPTTNNRMEILAIVKALEKIEAGEEAIIFSDSQYAIKCAMGEWKRNKNLDLWSEYDKVSKDKYIQFRWVKGHKGDPYNERADELASLAIKKLQPMDDIGYLKEIAKEKKLEKEKLRNQKKADKAIKDIFSNWDEETK